MPASKPQYDDDAFHRVPFEPVPFEETVPDDYTGVWESGSKTPKPENVEMKYAELLQAVKAYLQEKCYYFKHGECKENMPCSYTGALSDLCKLMPK